MSSEEAAMAIVNAMNGEAFCQDPELGLSEEQVAGCQGFIEAFMPPALSAYFETDDPSAAYVCGKYYGIC